MKQENRRLGAGGAFQRAHITGPRLSVAAVLHVAREDLAARRMAGWRLPSNNTFYCTSFSFW